MRINLNVSCGVMIILIQSKVKDGLVADLLPITFVEVVSNLHGGLEGVLEAPEVIVLEASSQLALKVKLFLKHVSTKLRSFNKAFIIIIAFQN